MADKLLNINEVSEYLSLDKEQVRELVDKGLIPAYKIAGSFLRFNKNEIDQARDKIYQFISSKSQDKNLKDNPQEPGYSAGERVFDFFYFNNFYIASIVIIIAILYVIFS